MDTIAFGVGARKVCWPDGYESPEVGRPFPDLPELRELIIEFGDSGYVALYRYERADDTAYVLAFRHQKEAGY